MTSACSQSVVAAAAEGVQSERGRASLLDAGLGVQYVHRRLLHGAICSAAGVLPGKLCNVCIDLACRLECAWQDQRPLVLPESGAMLEERRAGGV